ncbi:hypothetical protein EV715DRAFT_297939 [Schizophyllum commune]
MLQSLLLRRTRIDPVVRRARSQNLQIPQSAAYTDTSFSFEVSVNARRGNISDTDRLTPARDQSPSTWGDESLYSARGTPPRALQHQGLLEPCHEHTAHLWTVRVGISPQGSASSPFTTLIQFQPRRRYQRQSPGDLNDALPTTSMMKSSQLGRDDGRAVSAALALEEVAVVVTWRMHIIVDAGRACLPSPRGVALDRQSSFERKVLIQARVSLDVWVSVEPTVPHRHRGLFQSFHFRGAGREAAYCRPLIIATEAYQHIVLNTPPPTHEMKSITTREAIDRRSASVMIAGNA